MSAAAYANSSRSASGIADAAAFSVTFIRFGRMGVRIFFSFPPNSRSHLIQSFGSAFRRSLIFSGTVPSPVHIFIHYQLKNNFANSASFSHDGIETVTFTCIHFRIAFNHIGFGSVKWPDPGASTKRDRLERGKTRWSSDRGKCWFDSPAFWFIPSFLMSLCQLDWNCSCVLVLFRLGSGFVLFFGFDSNWMLIWLSISNVRQRRISWSWSIFAPYNSSKSKHQNNLHKTNKLHESMATSIPRCDNWIEKWKKDLARASTECCCCWSTWCGQLPQMKMQQLMLPCLELCCLFSGFVFSGHGDLSVIESILPALH